MTQRAVYLCPNADSLLRLCADACHEQLNCEHALKEVALPLPIVSIIYEEANIQTVAPLHVQQVFPRYPRGGVPPPFHPSNDKRLLAFFPNDCSTASMFQQCAAEAVHTVRVDISSDTDVNTDAIIPQLSGVGSMEVRCDPSDSLVDPPGLQYLRVFDPVHHLKYLKCTWAQLETVILDRGNDLWSYPMNRCIKSVCKISTIRHLSIQHVERIQYVYPASVVQMITGKLRNLKSLDLPGSNLIRTDVPSDDDLYSVRNYPKLHASGSKLLIGFESTKEPLDFIGAVRNGICISQDEDGPIEYLTLSKRSTSCATPSKMVRACKWYSNFESATNLCLEHYDVHKPKAAIHDHEEMIRHYISACKHVLGVTQDRKINCVSAESLQPILNFPCEFHLSNSDRTSILERDLVVLNHDQRYVPYFWSGVLKYRMILYGSEKLLMEGRNTTLSEHLVSQLLKSNSALTDPRFGEYLFSDVTGLKTAIIRDITQNAPRSCTQLMMGRRRQELLHEKIEAYRTTHSGAAPYRQTMYEIVTSICDATGISRPFVSNASLMELIFQDCHDTIYNNVCMGSAIQALSRISVCEDLADLPSLREEVLKRLDVINGLLQDCALFSYDTLLPVQKLLMSDVQEAVTFAMWELYQLTHHSDSKWKYCMMILLEGLLPSIKAVKSSSTASEITRNRSNEVLAVVERIQTRIRM